MKTVLFILVEIFWIFPVSLQRSGLYGRVQFESLHKMVVCANVECIAEFNTKGRQALETKADVISRLLFGLTPRKDTIRKPVRIPSKAITITARLISIQGNLLRSPIT